VKRRPRVRVSRGSASPIAGLQGWGDKKKGRELTPAFPVNREDYFDISSFFAAFFDFLAFLLFFAFFLLPSFVISFFSIGLAPAWDAATAKPLDKAKTAAINSDMSFFIR